MMNQNIDIKHIHSIYFVGIKGIAMTSLAVWAKEKGIRVAGSDTKEDFPSVPILKQLHITPLVGFSADHVSQEHPDLVVYTGAHQGRDNVEVQEAMRLGIPALAHGRALGLVMEEKKQISVAGSHGKTTTSAMIATILSQAKQDPSYAIGCGEIRGLGLPGHSGTGDYFVAEADEYVTDPTHDATPRFLWQNPDILVVTNIDYDHPDAYASLAAVQDAFMKLVKREKGRKITVVNIDDPASKPLIDEKLPIRLITYGTSEESDYRATEITFRPGNTQFTVLHHNKSIGKFTVRVPGEHNVRDSLSAIVACVTVGLSPKEIALGLNEFRGAKRRFELLGTHNGVEFYDDYAHHPKEIAATLAAVQAWYTNDRLIVVFQPHTYSRTKALMSDFGTSFASADIVIATDIYASAREKDSMGITGDLFVREVQKHHEHVFYGKTPADVESILRKTIKSGDRVVFMGAGDIYSWEKDVVSHLGVNL